MAVLQQHACFCLAGVRLRVECADPLLLDEISSTLGHPETAEGSETAWSLSVSVHAGEASTGYVHLNLETRDADALSPADLLLGLASPDFPFRLLPEQPPWTALALAGEQEPFLLLDGPAVQVRLAQGWRKAVALLLLYRLMRVRRDAIFFHASSVSLGGRGALFVGPKGAGKSTLALALAARGHSLLGDEHACYRPGTREILPFRRPVGIKPGPRAAAVDEALARIGRSPERDGMMRIDIESLLPVGPAAPAPLAAVVFLGGFAPEPRMTAVEPGRADLAQLQPVGSSLVNAPRAERVFQMTRMLGGARVFRLRSGDVDATVSRIQEAASAWD